MATIYDLDTLQAEVERLKAENAAMCKILNEYGLYIDGKDLCIVSTQERKTLGEALKELERSE